MPTREFSLGAYCTDMDCSCIVLSKYDLLQIIFCSCINVTTISGEKMPDRFSEPSESDSSENKLDDRMTKQLLTSVINH